ISTDDAYVEGSIYTISPKINGTVLKVYVKDNQFVKKGTLLVELDPSVYQRDYEQAKAGYEATKTQIEELQAAIRAETERLHATEKKVSQVKESIEAMRAGIKAQKAGLDAAKAKLQEAEKAYRRAKNLFQKHVIPEDRYDRAEAAYLVAKASVKAQEASLEAEESKLRAQEASLEEVLAMVRAEKAALEQMKKKLQTLKASLKAKRAQMEKAGLLLSYTKIYAPEAGFVTKKAVEEGENLRAGQPIMAVVPLEGVYVVANYKETKVHKIRPGMKVRIKVDAYPGKVFWGRVESIMAGTGAVFSLFPPENATGNFVKVVQRIPVKIVLEPGQIDPEHPLRLGMSVVPTVYVKLSDQRGPQKVEDFLGR
ncbi:MAG: HlyD family secretion protein, partial [Nitrospirae bacterium]